MTTFPGGIWAPTTKVDAVDYVLASHVNDIQNEIVALETYAFDKAIGPNLLYSTLSHDIWPAGVTFTGILDDTYANLWNSLHDGVTPTITGVAGGSTDPFARYLKFANGGTVYGGIVQFLSSGDTIPLRGLPVSISADLWGTNITTLRMAVIVWTSTADTITSDVVGVWGAGNPTLATNWAYIGTPADITITTTRTRFSVANLTVPTNANNIGLFIWLPGQEASGDFFNVARAKLEKGTVATEFAAPNFGEELRRVQRLYFKSFPMATAPAQNAGTAGAFRYVALAAGAIAIISPSYTYPTTMRAAPTVTLYNPSAANAQVRDNSIPGDCTASSVSAISDEGKFALNSTGNAATVAGNSMLVHVTADARL